MSGKDLTDRIARLENDLSGTNSEDVRTILDDAGMDLSLFHSALLVRSNLGRLSDLIHATAIALVLPRLLEPGERLERPSLAAGNDPSRPFDLETDRRVAEFKLARWQGADAMRKRQVFKDLVHLAGDDSERRPELYVLGDRPIRFLRASRSRASWGLDRAKRERVIFGEQFGQLDRTIADFTACEGARVMLIDLEEKFPQLFAEVLLDN